MNFKKIVAISLILIGFSLTSPAFMSFDWSAKKSDSVLQNADGLLVKSSTAPSIDKLAKVQPVKLDFEENTGKGSDSLSRVLNAHAAYLPFSGTPYTGTPISLPGKIQAENFDNGGEGVAYHDTTATNDGGSYRAEGVDICNCGSPYGLSVGWTQNAEWMEYTVSVATSGAYKFHTLTATIGSGTALHIEVDGVNVTGQMTLPNTGAWHVYGTTVSPAVTLSAGQHVVRVVVDVTGFLLDSIDVTPASTPFGGTAIALPGTIQAENFNNGGEGVAYHDTTTTNDGGYYRAEGVDICTCGSPYGLSVGWTQNAEWMDYTVSVASYGTYKFQTLTATIGSGTALHIEVDGVNVTGQMTLPNTGAWHIYATTTSPGVVLTPGQHVVRVVVDVTGFLLDSIAVTRANTPFGGTATALPGTIQVKNFDDGGEGFAYHDTTPANEGGAYRSEGVDLCNCSALFGAALGWSQTGEWTKYTVNVSTTDTYTLQASISTISSGSVIHLEVDGVNVTGPMVIPNTGGWGNWQTVSKTNVPISAGQHEIKMVIDSGGFLLETISAIPSVPSAPSNLTASAVSSSQINLTWTDNSFNESGFKIERKTGPSGTYAEIATTAAGVSSFSNTGLQTNTQYFYRLRATNLGGNSAYSNESSATTLNLPPSVSVTSPGAGSVFNAPANITIQASASDADGTVSKVEFFEGSTKLGEDLSAPYSFSWTNVGAGTYNLTAKATDNSGGSATSGGVAITVNALPTVSVTAPAANTLFHEPANITITASASDADGTVSKVEFFEGSTKLGEDLSAPYSFSWTNVGAGAYTLTAKATDNSGASTPSAGVAITVNALPTVSVTAPAANTVFQAPANITITASASDGDGTVSKVEFFQGSTKLGEDLSAPYSFNWTNVGAGAYNLTAKATDNSGGSTPSTGVPITVNGPPTISVTAPAANTVFNAPVNITIAASASDPDGAIAKVEFFQNGTLLGEDTTSPYTYLWTNAPTGVFSLTARATDNSSATITSSPVTITVNNPPSVSITAPAANSTFVPGATVPIAATASDTDGTISKVEFYQGTTKLGEDLTSPFTFNWTNVPQGNYSLSAIATDNRDAATPSTAVPITVFASGISRLDPMNRTGGGMDDPLSRNFNWNLPLVRLPGRSGMDLELTLSYNSLVWTRSGSVISYDDDKGFPSPGFRLGFPVIQQLYYNSEVGKQAYLLIGTDGSRTELRQVGTSVFFEAADSSHLLLDTSLSLPAPDNDKFILRTADGTRLLYAWKGVDYQCTQVRDRNGNYITINYTAAGHIDTIVDTLNRVIKFNYNGDGRLETITQVWKQGTASERTHTWASFEYTEQEFQTAFTDLTVVGPANNSEPKLLSKVTLADNSTTINDNSRFEFAYTSWGQIWKVSNFAADNHLLNYRSYNLPLTNSPSQIDCPRFTERRDWAENWNRTGSAGLSGLPSGPEQEVLTTFGIPNADENDTWTMPDGTSKTGTRTRVTIAEGTADKVTNEIYFIGKKGESTGWRRGLPALVKTFDNNGGLQRQVMTTWRQNSETVSYPLNPRVEETNIYDPSNNRKRTRVTYETITLPDGMNCKLPQDVFEYSADPDVVLRRTHTVYSSNDAYKNRRIVGLPVEKTLYEFNPATETETLRSKMAFSYDESPIEGTVAPVQHDNGNFGTGFTVGRANMTSVRRYDVTTSNPEQFTTTTHKYNRAGSIVSSKDAVDHEVTMSYTDAFAANGTTLDAERPFATLAYPTTVTDAGSNLTSSRYNYDFGAPTWKQTPLPNDVTYAAGPQQKITYDNIGRVEQITNLANNAYTRFVYSGSKTRVDKYVAIQQVSGQIQEAHSFRITDGLGRVFATASAHPGSTGGFSGGLVLFDALGRPIKTSNPTETSASDSPKDWAAVGNDAPPDVGWLYTQQTYDWRGRPLVTTNPDGTTKEASYAGCGCAGGTVTTLTDEGTATATVTKRRQQRIYADVLGRAWKTEVMNWDGTGPNGTGPNNTVYTTTVNTFNARDQITKITKYAGTAASSTSQDTVMTYDGFGRLKTRHAPEQNEGTATTWDYNADDTVQKITDARGASKTFAYNSRHLVTGITYAWPGGSPVPGAVSYTYDAAGNRKNMTDGTGTVTYHYDQLSRLDWEERTFTGLGGSVYRLSYAYNLADELTSLTEPTQFGTSVSYSYDTQGRVSEVTGSGFAGGVTQLASGMKYHASGALSEMLYGNGLKLNNTFNSRLQIKKYQVKVPGTPEGQGERARTDYSYHLDGKIGGAIDHTDQGFNRGYGYDHVGRLTGAGSSNSAYQLTLSYDQFDNLIERRSFVWRAFHVWDSTYLNNRSTQTSIWVPPAAPEPATWTYDADGRVIHDHNKEITFNAAGDKTRVFESNQIEPTLLKKLWIHQDYDGNGARAKRVEQEQMNTGFLHTTTSYYLRSSILNGKVITELNEVGARRETNVYAHNTSLAKQKDNQVRWTHDDPVTHSHRETLSNGTVDSQLEFDPLGNDAPLTDPNPPEMTPDYDYVGNYGRSGNPYDGGGGCMIDGQQVPCTTMMQLVSMGTGRGMNSAAGSGGPGTVNALNFVWVDEWEDVETPPGTGTQGAGGGWTGSVTTQIRNVGRFVPVFTEQGQTTPTSLHLRKAKPDSFPSITPVPPTKPYVDRKVLKECIETLYGVELLSFTESRKGSNGSFTGRGPDGLSNEGNVGQIDVINEVNAYTSGQLKQMYNASLAPGDPPLGPNDFVMGLTGNDATLTAYRNFTAKNLTSAMDILKTQVHELGHSLQFIVGTNYPGDKGGQKLEDCVSAKGGFKN